MEDLYARLEEGFGLRGMSARSRKAYLGAVRQLERHCGRPPDELGDDEVVHARPAPALTGATVGVELPGQKHVPPRDPPAGGEEASSLRRGRDTGHRSPRGRKKPRLAARSFQEPCFPVDLRREYVRAGGKRCGEVGRRDASVAPGRVNIWRSQPPAFGKRAKIDVDGTMSPTTGEKKEGMALNHKGIWGYHPLLVSLANTREPLFIVNRPGNVTSHEVRVTSFPKSDVVYFDPPYFKRDKGAVQYFQSYKVPNSILLGREWKAENLKPEEIPALVERLCRSARHVLVSTSSNEIVP